MSAIEIKHLTYIYSRKTPYEKKALDDVNLCIEEGSFVGIVGATGSGKSTLIQHLNGFIKVQDKKTSSVVVQGMSATDKKTLKNLRFKVGMVFQYPEYQLFADTVEKDVAFGPKNMKLSKEEIDARVRKAMDVVGLDYDQFASRSPFDLSGGEKRRAAIAGVIAMQPEILVLDEPVAGLDPKGKRELMELLHYLHSETVKTVIMVSHDMDEVAENCTDVAVFSDGKVVMTGTPKEVFSKTDELLRLRLDVPVTGKIANELKKVGVDLDTDFTTDDFVEKVAFAYKNA